MWNKFVIKEFSRRDGFRREMNPHLTSCHETPSESGAGFKNTPYYIFTLSRWSLFPQQHDVFTIYIIERGGEDKCQISNRSFPRREACFWMSACVWWFSAGWRGWCSPTREEHTVPAEHNQLRSFTLLNENSMQPRMTQNVLKLDHVCQNAALHRSRFIIPDNSHFRRNISTATGLIGVKLCADVRGCQRTDTVSDPLTAPLASPWGQYFSP